MIVVMIVLVFMLQDTLGKLRWLWF